MTSFADFHKFKDQKTLLKELFKEAIECRNSEEQWLQIDRLDIALKYHYKLETYIELLENITSGHVGMGFNAQHDGSLETRLNSFSYLK